MERPGRVDGVGLERAELAADRVVLGAGPTDPGWWSFCVRQSDRAVVLRRLPGPPGRPARRAARLDGAKWHITSAPVATAAIVWAADPENSDIVGVLVEMGWDGVKGPTR